MVVIVIEKEERFMWGKTSESEHEFKASFANQFRDTINQGKGHLPKRGHAEEPWEGYRQIGHTWRQL